MNPAKRNRTAPRVLIVDEMLRDNRGHVGNLVRSLAEHLVARGQMVEVWGNRAAPADLLPAPIQLRRMFARTWWDAIFRPGAGGRMTGVLGQNIRLLAALARGGALLKPPGLAIAASSSIYHLLAWRVWLALVPRRCCLVLVLLQQPWLVETDAAGRLRLRGAARIYRRVFRLFRRVVESGRCRLVAETELHAQLLSRLGSVEFVAVRFPRPIEILRLSGQRPVRAPGAPLRFGFVGRSSVDKGFGVFLEAVERRSAATDIRYVVQWDPDPDSPPEWNARVIALARAKPGLVELVGVDLSPEDYANLIASLDGMVLPYRAADYVGRVSSVAADALCAGVPMVCTAGTGIEEAMRRWGAGVTCRDQDPTSLCAALGRLAGEHAVLSARAREHALLARQAHSCEYFFSKVAPAGWK